MSDKRIQFIEVKELERVMEEFHTLMKEQHGEKSQLYAGVIRSIGYIKQQLLGK